MWLYITLFKQDPALSLFIILASCYVYLIFVPSNHAQSFCSVLNLLWAVDCFVVIVLARHSENDRVSSQSQFRLLFQMLQLGRRVPIFYLGLR
ncbi:hypothetical protein VNO78_19575 [Psophocarpus tetragonolobus]|uniref:Uncharacterized protein n=1 Tax=Psophocarpus tetragonolobus TaxID=3891 RepID=A0AAN9XGA5_PSOTE